MAIIVHGSMKLAIPLLLGCIFKSISATNSKQPEANESTIEEVPKVLASGSKQLEASQSAIEEIIKKGLASGNKQLEANQSTIEEIIKKEQADDSKQPEVKESTIEEVPKVLVSGSKQLEANQSAIEVPKKEQTKDSKQPEANKSTIEEASSLKQEKYDEERDNSESSSLKQEKQGEERDSSESQESQDAPSIKLPDFKRTLERYQETFLRMHEESKKFHSEWILLNRTVHASFDKFFVQKDESPTNHCLGNVLSLLEDNRRQLHLFDRDCYEILKDSYSLDIRMETFYPDNSSELLSFDAACVKYKQGATLAYESFKSEVEKYRQKANAELKAIKEVAAKQIFLAEAEYKSFCIEDDKHDISIALRNAQLFLAEKKAIFDEFAESLKELHISPKVYDHFAITTADEAVAIEEISKLNAKTLSLYIETCRDIAVTEDKIKWMESDVINHLKNCKSQVAFELSQMESKMPLFFTDSNHQIDCLLGEGERLYVEICSNIPELSRGEKDPWVSFLEQREFLRQIRKELIESIMNTKMEVLTFVPLLKKAQSVSEEIRYKVDDIKSFCVDKLAIYEIKSEILGNVAALFVPEGDSEAFFEKAHLIVDHQVEDRLKLCKDYARIHRIPAFLPELEKTRKSLALVLENFDGDLKAHMALLLKRRDQFWALQKILIRELASVKEEYRRALDSLPVKEPYDEGFHDHFAVYENIKRSEREEIRLIMDTICLLEQRSAEHLENLMQSEEFKDADKKELSSSLAELNYLVGGAEYISDGSFIRLHEGWVEAAKSELLLSIQKR